MTISRRLIILLAVPLAALLGLGVFTRLELSNIEARSRFVAENQVKSLAALGEISRSFTELRVHLRSYLLATGTADRASAQSAFDAGEAELTHLLAQYADGLVSDEQDRRLLIEYRQTTRDWIVAAHQAMSLAAEGRRDEALAMLSGPTRSTRLKTVSAEWIRHNEELATTAGKTAVESIIEFQWKTLVADAAALLLTGILGLLTVRRIVKPIEALESSVRAMAAGDHARRVPFTEAKDETGGLARSIDVLKQGAAAMEEQRWVKSSAGKLTGTLQGTASLAAFGQRLLSGLVPLLGGGVAGLYVFEDDTGRLRRVASYGLAEGAAAANSFGLGEGLVGQSAQGRVPVSLSNLPPEYLRISSALGTAAPAQATAWPLLSREGLLGVLEVASLRALTATEQALLEELLPVVTMSLEILQRGLRMQDVLERTKLILESSADGIFGVDTEGLVTFVNPAACQLLGFAPEDLVGQPSHAAFHHHRSDGSLYPKEECPMFAAYKRGEPSRIDDEYLWRKDGTGLPVEYGATPLRKDGAVVGAVVSFTDITAKRRSFEETERQRATLKSVINSIPDLIFCKDPEGVYLGCNDAFAQLVGRPVEEIVGNTDFGLFPRDIAELFRAKDQEMLTDLQKKSNEEWVDYPDGRHVMLDTLKAPFFDERGQLVGLLGISRDITARKQAESALQKVASDLQDERLEAERRGATKPRG